MIALIPLELYTLAFWRPRTNNDEIYQSYSKLCLNFLANAGYSNDTFDKNKYEKQLKRIEREYIVYDIRYGQSIEL